MYRGGPRKTVPIEHTPLWCYAPPMPRFALKIEYDGSPYHGWQRQQVLPSVQATIEAAIARVDPTAPLVSATGRTDKGVHALGQMAHVDLARDWTPHKLLGALNYYLKPHPIAILDAARVDDDFHARFHALERHYLFRLISRRAPAIHATGKVWQVGHALDIEAMQEAANKLLGHHDFTTFRATACQAPSPMKTLNSLTIEQLPYPGGIEYNFHVRARSFLHNQVRSFVGTLERVGAGTWTPQDVQTALEARNRAACGPVCPPQGLYLLRAIYAQDPLTKG